MREPVALFASVVLAVVFAVALLAPWIAPHDPFEIDLGNALQGPGGQYLLGTDEQGRDTLSRMMHGLRLTLSLGLSSVAMGSVVGVLVGIGAAYFRRLDGLLMRMIDVLLSFPEILVALALAAVVGPGFLATVIAVSIATVPGTARVARSAALSVMGMNYMEAGRSIGFGHGHLIFRYLLPNCFSAILVIVTLRVGQVILIVSALSFLGLGAQPPTPELGKMASQGLQFFFIAPYLAILPSTLIMLLVLALNLAGDTLRDALDPRLRG
ncbi:ABC transporter permease [Stella sp.]|uniref:ABC transporter permease n=1 Tax=Stella sp. TaxID=2912054 RepID=UPI0035B46224